MSRQFAVLASHTLMVRSQAPDTSKKGSAGHHARPRTLSVWPSRTDMHWARETDHSRTEQSSLPEHRMSLYTGFHFTRNTFLLWAETDADRGSRAVYAVANNFLQWIIVLITPNQNFQYMFYELREYNTKVYHIWGHYINYAPTFDYNNPYPMSERENNPRVKQLFDASANPAHLSALQWDLVLVLWRYRLLSCRRGSPSRGCPRYANRSRTPALGAGSTAAAARSPRERGTGRFRLQQGERCVDIGLQFARTRRCMKLSKHR